MVEIATAESNLYMVLLTQLALCLSPSALTRDNVNNDNAISTASDWDPGTSLMVKTWDPETSLILSRHGTQKLREWSRLGTQKLH